MSKRILVTGASRGIGLGLVKTFLDKGHTVFAVSRQVEPRELLNLQKNAGERLVLIQAEITKASDRQRIREAVLAKTKALDWLVNNAGLYPSQDEDLLKLETKNLTEAFLVNTITPIQMTAELMPLLKKSEQAKVFFVTSLMGSISDNTSGGSYAYRMSKCALNMGVKTLSIDFPDIACVLLHPGWVQTDMGGPNAPTSIEESVTGLTTLMDRVGPRQTAHFYDYLGESIHW
ncbi:MAG: SDR family oxidoreductase [Proteobacteria bacterium]|nr:MAG: SDR family oxidoreductase [Pseudomonadota bacterium]